MHSPGIEPGSYAWEAYILPLNHGCLVKNLFFFFPSCFLPKTTTKRIEFEFEIEIDGLFTLVLDLR